MTDTFTAEFWKGEFGYLYTRRNRVDWRARIAFWDRIMEKTSARSVYEFGCNAGWNLTAITQACDWSPTVTGCEINLAATLQANAAGINAKLHNILEEDREDEYELTFTSGVLIHIAPKDLSDVMHTIAKASSDYVLAVEYASEVEEEVEYRGFSGKLWKRPYGKLYEDMGLKLVETGKAGKEYGFDDCQFWLMKKF